MTKAKKARKQMLTLLLALAMVLTSAAVPTTTAEAAKTVKVKKVQITSPKKKTVTLVKGKTLQIKVKITPSNAKNKKVTYKSSKKKIASVTSKGKVKGLKKGTAKITVTAKDGSKKKATLTVKVVNPVKVKTVKLNKTSVSIEKGKTYTLKATISPKNATNKEVTWKTSNKAVATVTSKGVVKGVKAGTATITATAKDGSKKKATCKVTVAADTPAATLEGIEVTTPPTKTAYYVGDKFNPEGMVVTASYSDKTTKALGSSAYQLSPSVDTALKASDEKITVTYTEGNVTKTAETPITVTVKPEEGKTLESIAVTTPPTKTAYYVGDKFNPEGMVVTATYSDGASKKLDSDVYRLSPSVDTALKASDNKITVTYTEGDVTKTAETPISVTVKPEEGKTLQSIAVTTPPTKTAYYVGDKINLEGMVVTATYSDNTKKVLESDAYQISPSVDTALKASDNKITVTYTEGDVTKTAETPISVTVKPEEGKTLQSIAVTTQPTKTAYKVGETFDPAGMAVTATYKDASGNETTAVLDSAVYTISPTAALTVNNTKVTVTYTEGSVTKTATVTITVTAEAAVESIRIKTQPTKLTYMEGETFAPAGMKVEAVLADESVKDITEACTYPTGALEVTKKADKSKITISYVSGGKTFTAEVEILVKAEHPLTGITAVLKNPGAALPRKGASFTDDDVTVTAQFDGAEAKTILRADYEVDPAEFTENTVSATIKYRYGGVTKTATVSGFTVTEYREGYTFEDADSVGTIVKRSKKADGSEKDSVPTEGNAGDVTPQFAQGVVGKALKLDGTYGLRLDKIVGTKSESYSISMWVKPERLARSQALVISTAKEFGLFEGARENKLDETWCGIAGDNDGKGFKFWSHDEGGYVEEHGKLPVSYGANAAWTHIAIVVDGRTTLSGKAPAEGATRSLGTVYLNGRKVYAVDINNEKLLSGNGAGEMKTYIGVNGWANDGYFKGLVDELVFTNNVMTAEDVEAAYFEDMSKAGHVLSNITELSDEEIEVPYGTSLADLKDKLADISFKGTLEGSEETVTIPTTADMWDVGDYTITAEGEVTATASLTAPDKYVFKNADGTTVYTTKTATVKIKITATLTAITPSDGTLEVAYGTTEDEILDKLKELTFAVTTDNGSSYTMENIRSKWSLTEGDDGNYKAKYNLGLVPAIGYKYKEGLKVEVAVNVKQPLRITGLTSSAQDNKISVVYGTSEKNIKETLAALQITATMSEDTADKPAIKNDVSNWTLTGYDTSVDTEQKCTATGQFAAPAGYAFAENADKVTVEVTVQAKSTEKTLGSIDVTTAPSKDRYLEGDMFDEAGMVITANYANGVKEAVTIYTVEEINSETGLAAGTKGLKISYTEDEITVTTTCPITVVKVEDGADVLYGFDDNLKNSKDETKIAKVVNESSLTDNNDKTPNYQEGVKGKSILFDKDPIGVELAESIDKEDTDFTLNLWVMPKATPGSWSMIVGGVRDATTEDPERKQLMIYANPAGSAPNSINVQATDTAVKDKSLEKAITIGKWTMLTWVNKADGVEFYVNGNKQTLDAAFKLTKGVDRLIIGAGPWAGRFNGYIDEVSIYKSSLKAGQVEKLYKSIKSTVYSVSVDPKEEDFKFLASEAGDNAVNIQSALKALQISSVVKGDNPELKNDEDWTLTPAYNGAGSYNATKAVTIPAGYVKGENLQTQLSVPVKVVDNSTLSSIQITTPPNNVRYMTGETFDKTGMKVMATYGDGIKRDVSDKVTCTTEALVVSPEDGTEAGSGTRDVKISFTDGGVTKETTQKITLYSNAEEFVDAIATARTGYYTFDDEDNYLKNEVGGGSATLGTVGTYMNTQTAPEPVKGTGVSGGKSDGSVKIVTGGKGITLDAEIADSKTYTISMWVNATNLGEVGSSHARGQKYACVLSMTGTGSNYDTRWFSNVEGNDKDFMIRAAFYNDRNGHESGNIQGVLVKNGWKMLTLSVTNNVGTLYVDGKVKGTVNMRQGTNCSIHLGVAKDGGDDTFNGEYDEISVFADTALTEKEINALYTVSKP